MTPSGGLHIVIYKAVKNQELLAMRETLGDRIKRALQVSGRLQTELASAVGCSQPTVSLWIKGKRNPSLREITAMAEYLDVSPSWLAWGVTPGSVNVDEERLQRAVDILRKTKTPESRYGERLKWIYENLDDETVSGLIDDLLATRKD